MLEHLARCGLGHSYSCKHKPLALDVFSRWLSTLGLWFNQWPSWWYSFHVTNCVGCVHLIEADPHSLPKHFHSLPDLHQDISPDPHKTRLHNAYARLTSLHPCVLWYCRFVLYCSSISRQEQASLQPSWFRQGRGCIDQVLVLRQVCNKYLANGKYVYWVFTNLEKGYDTIDRHGMWQMLRVYGVGGKLLKAVQSFMWTIWHVSGWEMMWVNGFRLMLD